MLRPFELAEPASVGEASALLARHGEAARLYAGGTELLLAMKEGLVHYDYLVNVKTIPGLGGLRRDGDGTLRIGAAATHRAVERDPVVREHFTALARMEADVANVRVRTVGTLGGNLCFAEPHADPGALLQVFDATVRLERAGRARTLPLEALFVGPFETCLEGDELLTEIAVPPLPPRSAAAYLKFGFLERPSVGVAVAVTVADGHFADARVAVGSVGPVPRRMREAEAVLREKAIAESPAALEEAGRLAARAADAVTDLHGSAEYKEHLVAVLLRRAFRQALASLGVREPS
ncbi:MAG TPA: xanthine dehydrogenase family protein subunit M [Methylomirabilota bacterium]|nr:xanthine dehydrogenase family protein subunit M [Methylomirabilota bacterium]